jgi:CheY-like chemotaxis protein
MNRILVAEDNPTNRELLRELLENTGTRSSGRIGDGHEALSAMELNLPDILLV